MVAPLSPVGSSWLYVYLCLAPKCDHLLILALPSQILFRKVVLSSRQKSPRILFFPVKNCLLKNPSESDAENRVWEINFRYIVHLRISSTKRERMSGEWYHNTVVSDKLSYGL